MPSLMPTSEAMAAGNGDVVGASCERLALSTRNFPAAGYPRLIALLVA